MKHLITLSLILLASCYSYAQPIRSYQMNSLAWQWESICAFRSSDFNNLQYQKEDQFLLVATACDFNIVTESQSKMKTTIRTNLKPGTTVKIGGICVRDSDSLKNHQIMYNMLSTNQLQVYGVQANSGCENQKEFPIAINVYAKIYE